MRQGKRCKTQSRFMAFLWCGECRNAIVTAKARTVRVQGSPETFDLMQKWEFPLEGVCKCGAWWRWDGQGLRAHYDYLRRNSPHLLTRTSVNDKILSET